MKNTNKSILTLSAIALLSTFAVTAQAQTYGNVLSVVPIYQQIGIPQQVCRTEQVVVEQQKSGGGALLGAIAGGAIGNQFGRGSGKDAATILGVLGGAVVGNNVEGNPGSRTENVQRCSTQTAYENRTVGYTVTYEYAGRQYTTQTQRDPGQYIEVNVAPVQSQPRFVPQSYQPTPNSYTNTVVTTYPQTLPYYPQTNYTRTSNATDVGLAVGIGALAIYGISNMNNHHNSRNSGHNSNHNYRRY